MGWPLTDTDRSTYSRLEKMEKIPSRTRRPMTIGSFARAAGVGVETIRFYERKGLLDKPARPTGSVRLYSEAMVARMAFIRRAQALGFTLEEIKNLLALSARKGASGSEILQLKLRELDARVVELNRMRKQLRRHVALCERAKPDAPCPFLSLLSESGNERAR